MVRWAGGRDSLVERTHGPTFTGLVLYSTGYDPIVEDFLGSTVALDCSGVSVFLGTPDNFERCRLPQEEARDYFKHICRYFTAVGSVRDNQDGL